MKLAVVGPSAEKWTPEQIPKVKQWIKNMFHALGFDNVLVSGHDFIGKIAEEIADELGIKKEIYPAEINQWPDGSECLCCGDILPFTDEEQITKHTKSKLGGWNNTKRLKGYRSRNIQIAKACDVLYCIVPRVEKPKSFDEHISFGTYKFLPIQSKDLMTENYFCFHCHSQPDSMKTGFSKGWGHPTNGGCWTMKYTKKLGKETHLVVIE